MKKKFFTLSLLSILLSSPVFSQDSGFGVGAILGSPTGVSFKVWASKTSAFDAAVTWSFYNNGSINFHFDYLWHKFNLIPVDEGKFPLYIGVGPKFGFSTDIELGAQFELGFRVPVGVDYIFKSVPIDIFVEVAPSLMVLPETVFRLDGGLGARYFF